MSKPQEPSIRLTPNTEHSESDLTPEIFVRADPLVGRSLRLIKYAFVLSLLGAVFWLRSEVSELTSEQASLHAELEQVKSNLAAMNSEHAAVRASLEKLREQQLASRLQQPAAARNEQSETASTLRGIDPRFIKPGLYTVSTTVSLSRVRRLGTVDEDLTIYHITSPLRSSASATTSQRLHIALAIGGLTSGPQIYIDHNDDGKVDAEMLYDFISLVPYSGIFAKSLSEDNSQRTYEAFLQHADKAEFLSLDEIESKGSSVAKALWQFVSSQSGRLGAWIQKQTPTGSSAAPSGTVRSGKVGDNTF